MNPMKTTEKLQDSVIQAVETSQRWTLGALRSVTSAFDAATPDLSRSRFADRMPSAVDAVDVTFAFAGRLLDAQHAFVLGLLGLSSPAAEPVVPVKPRVVRGSFG
jgi:hypothetical protein